MSISRISKTVLLFGLIAYAGLFGRASAEERTIPLKEALLIALSDNPEIRAQSMALAATQEDVGIAGSYLLPKVAFEERFMRTTTPAYAFSFKMNQERFSAADLLGAPDTFNHPPAISDFQTSLTFEQPLYAPKAYAGVALAKKEHEARTHELDRKKEEVALKVFRAYRGVMTSRAYVQAAQKGIEDAEAHLRVAEVRYKEGIGIYSDVLRARVALSTATERKVSANKNMESARRALGLMLGLTESLDIIPEEQEIAVRDIEHYYATSGSRKDLKAMQSRVTNAGNMLKMAHAGYLPVLGIGGAYQINDHKKPFGSDGESWQMMAFLKWELFDGTKREHESRKAKYKINEAEEYLNGMKKEIAYQIYDAYLSVGEAREGQALARASLEAAEEGTRIVSLRFENSLSSMIELLDMQTGLDAARAGLVEKESAYLSAAANLWFQSGSILKELGLE
ncbi:MAG: TolC family protein [Nitrospirae bacterium]|nr:MAG: TolC family protein [Nitrospirota bacterium]